MATRTAKGQTALKASGTNLEEVSVAMTKGESLLAAVVFKGQTLPDRVTWGDRVGPTRDLSKVGHRLNATDNFSVAVYQGRRILNTTTRKVLVTWASAITARWICVISLDTPHVRDDAAIARAIQGATGVPSVGPTGEMDRSDGFVWGILGAEGPFNNDTQPTISSPFTKGQEGGTNGSPAAGNLYGVEAYTTVSSSVPVTLSGTGATSRPWTNILIPFMPVQFFATDKFGSEIVVGDTVRFEGNMRIVNTLRRGQNHVDLATDGWVTASEVEVLN